MSGYWSALAAAARGGADGQADAAPVTAPPVFDGEAGDDGEDWGALDIEEAAPAPSTVRRTSRTASAEPEPPPSKADGNVLPPTLEKDEASAPVSRTAVDDAPPELSEAHPVVPAPQPDADVAHPLAAPIIPLVVESAGSPVARATEESPACFVTMETGSADGTAAPVDSAPVAGAPATQPVHADIPVADPVDATPVVQLAAIGDLQLGEPATTMTDDAIHPIHVHIDRIDIRLDVAPGAPVVDPRRRAAAPVVALDDFLRRPSERGQ
ncbi:hypothetical protein ACIPPQ_04905 [Sphingopyxis sp. LARHCG72]